MEEDDVKSIKELPSEEKWRMISILSYVIVLIGFGVPIWWHTTRVYRANLPLDEMLEMHQSSPTPMPIFIHAATETRSRHLSEEIKSVLGATIDISIHKSSISLPISDDDLDIQKAASLVNIQDEYLVFIEWPKAPKNIILTSERVVFFKSDVSGYRLAMLVQLWPGVDLKTALADPKHTNLVKDSMRAYTAAPKYDILITVVNPEPQNLNVDFDVVDAADEYLLPYLSALKNVANFTVKSQWLYFVDLGVNPRHIGDHWALAEQLLPHIITPLEKKLSSQVSKDPCINLVIYVPPCHTSPIHIYTKEGIRSQGSVDAFVSPRWGGLQIANHDCQSKNFTPNSQEVMSTLITQFNQLLGIPDLVSSALDEIHQTGFQPSTWQVDYLLRSRTLEYLDAARLTLRSLAQLLSEISNIVINDEVADSVRIAVLNTAQAKKLLESGDFLGAFRASQLAALSAEAAFTDPSLLALLYFPDDQKYAVYIPLFLPIMIPVIMSLGQLVKYAKKSKTLSNK